MARRDSNDANPILWIIFLIALYISTFFIDIPGRTLTGFSFFDTLLSQGAALMSRSTLSIVAAALFLAATAVSLHLLNNAFSSGLNYILPLLYLILSLANPYSIYFTPFHVAALLLVWSIWHFVKFKAATGHMSDLFTALFLLVAASCFYAPLIWLAPFLLVAGFAYAEGKLRYLATFILAVAGGAAAAFGTLYLFYDFDTAVAASQGYLGEILAVDIQVPHVSILQAVRDGIIAILVILAMLRNVRNQGKYKIAESRMLSDVALCTALLFVVMVLFLNDYTLPYNLVVLAPASMVIFGLFGDSKKTMVTIFSLIVMGLIVAERASHFIMLDGVPLIDKLNI